MERQKRLILIDGHAILHRAFHALPPLTTSEGQEVGAVFGFCSMLLRVIQDLKPQYLIVTFDLPKPTFRQKLYANYQAQRPEMDKELSSQIEVVHKVLQTMEIPIFEDEGYEADDVIGTLAAQASKTQNLETIIVTGDRDMLQLINDKVKVYAPVKGLAQTVLYDEQLVEEKYGLGPSQWVDFKALVGDPSDNYPGVSGIGPKTAAGLLQKYKTLEDVYQNLDKLSVKQAQVLREEKDQAKMAKTLAQIVTSAPLELGLKECELKELKTDKVEKLFRELEFKSLWERITKLNNPNSDLPEKEGSRKKIKDDSQLSLLN